ncbi:18376_t:CDS:2 [Funneliformis geosporum]|uniref:16310_t:CDS:1 n=1 Tax=Funneliformis geosporum TaxID=1117311 RepID=A0A9W4WNT7_9GLOM|nr:18376_t:CDS:2 [Funneliformis geosporum]CAI2175749.1 16310_t:CDS:2 [Funneliformis geosporum]
MSIPSTSSTPRCMKGISIIHVGKRNFRVPTASLPEGLSSGQDIYVRHDKENKKPVIINTKTENEKKDNKTGRAIKTENEGFINDYITIDQIPSAFYGLIIGKQGATIKRIKYETNTYINIISDKELVNIRGYERCVNNAKQMIYDIMEYKKLFLPPTHFISLPINDPTIRRNVDNFQSEVLQLKLANIDESILIKPPSLHLTIGMLNLYSKEDIRGAVSLLKRKSQEIHHLIHNLIGTRAIVSDLTGIEIMGDDKEKTHVLYSKIEEPEGRNILEKLGEFLTDIFEKARYLKKDDRPLKLHATLIKTRHRDDGNGVVPNHDNRQRELNRIPFNATTILDKFSNTVFGTCIIGSIHISKIGEYDEMGRYRSEGSIRLH